MRPHKQQQDVVDILVLHSEEISPRDSTDTVVSS